MNPTPDDPTDEMVNDAWHAFLGLVGPEVGCDRTALRAALTAVLAIVNRDRCPHPAGHDQAPQCPVCTSPNRHRRFEMPVMDAGQFLGNRSCSDPWHDGLPPSVRSVKPDVKLPGYPASGHLRAPEQVDTRCPCRPGVDVADRGHDPWCRRPANPLRA